PRFIEALPRVLEAGRRLDAAVLDAAAFAVADSVQRAEDLAAELVGLVDDHRALFFAPPVVRRLAEHGLKRKLLEEQKLHLAKIGLVAILRGARHGDLLGRAGGPGPIDRPTRVHRLQRELL